MQKKLQDFKKFLNSYVFQNLKTHIIKISEYFPPNKSIETLGISFLSNN